MEGEIKSVHPGEIIGIRTMLLVSLGHAVGKTIRIGRGIKPVWRDRRASQARRVLHHHRLLSLPWTQPTSNAFSAPKAIRLCRSACRALAADRRCRPLAPSASTRSGSSFRCSKLERTSSPSRLACRMGQGDPYRLDIEDHVVVIFLLASVR